RVALDIIRSLGMRKPAGYKGAFYRANLRIIAQKKGGGRNTRRDMLSVIRGHANESGIVYCATRRGVDSLTEWLAKEGVSVLPYHAGLDDRARARHQEAFARDEVNVVVATIAFGMGIDKSNVRYVIHRDMPRSIESYYQEIGRAGRDGLPSDCVLFYSWADVLAYDRFTSDGDAAAGARQRALVREMFDLASARGCRHRLAAERGVPAYVVFSDATLLRIAQQRPSSDEELLAISGIGPKKLELYGHALREVVAGRAPTG